jgi:DNA repair protein RadC
MYKPDSLPIKSWAEEDRPREKMRLRGRNQLSDAELLAIILGSGTREESAVALARRILHAADNNLDELGKCTLSELTRRFKGVGEAKAISILAALELGRRRQLTDIRQRPKVSSSRDSYEAMASMIADLPHEEFWILLLNRANLILGREQISSGGTAGTVVDAKILFLKAVEYRAAALVMFHNHPSGNLKPSQADLELTRKLVLAGKTLDIAVLDHIIVAGKTYYSFADENLI